MNKNKQSKSSVIFSTCWTERGATAEQIQEALELAGYDMPVDARLLPMLKRYQRDGWLRCKRDSWNVGTPYPKKNRGR